MNESGNWSINLFSPLSNLAELSATNGMVNIDLTYVFFEAELKSKTQIEGIAKAGTVITSGNISAVANEENRFKLILEIPLMVDEVVIIETDQGTQRTLTYIPKFTAYVDSDGATLRGTSNTEQVVILHNGEETTVNVEQENWMYSLPAPLQVGESVTIECEQGTKELTYAGPVQFTAALSEDKAHVVGSVDQEALIQLMFRDNSLIEQLVEPGEFDINLGRTLSAGDFVVLACLVDDNTVISFPMFAM